MFITIWLYYVNYLCAFCGLFHWGLCFKCLTPLLDSLLTDLSTESVDKWMIGCVNYKGTIKSLKDMDEGIASRAQGLFKIRFAEKLFIW